jgi:hypothetical protein
MALALLFTLNCRVCNPHPLCDPVLYDDLEKRDYEARVHADKTGHVLDTGYTASIVGGPSL